MKIKIETTKYVTRFFRAKFNLPIYSFSSSGTHNTVILHTYIHVFCLVCILPNLCWSRKLFTTSNPKSKYSSKETMKRHRTCCNWKKTNTTNNPNNPNKYHIHRVQIRWIWIKPQFHFIFFSVFTKPYSQQQQQHQVQNNNRTTEKKHTHTFRLKRHAYAMVVILELYPKLKRNNHTFTLLPTLLSPVSHKCALTCSLGERMNVSLLLIFLRHHGSLD